MASGRRVEAEHVREVAGAAGRDRPQAKLVLEAREDRAHDAAGGAGEAVHGQLALVHLDGLQVGRGRRRHDAARRRTSAAMSGRARRSWRSPPRRLRRAARRRDSA